MPKGCPRYPQEEPNGAQECFPGAPETCQGGSRNAHRAPKAAKRTPSAAKRGPSAAQGRPWGPKIFEKRPPGPNRWKSDSNGFPKEGIFGKNLENQPKSLCGRKSEVLRLRFPTVENVRTSPDIVWVTSRGLQLPYRNKYAKKQFPRKLQTSCILSLISCLGSIVGIMLKHRSAKQFWISTTSGRIR